MRNNINTTDRISVYNEELSKKLKEEFSVMTSAYAFMRDTGLDITSEVFEREIARIKTPAVVARETTPSIVVRFRKYADDALKYSIIGTARHKHIIVVSDKLERFLLINGISSIIPSEFNEIHLMEFRDFIYSKGRTYQIVRPLKITLYMVLSFKLST